MKHRFNTTTTHLLSADLLPCLHPQPLDAPHSPPTPTQLPSAPYDEPPAHFRPQTSAFPDETPDAGRISSTTEPAHFSDIDKDNPSPHDDEPPPMDDDAPVVNAIGTGGVDTGDRASAPLLPTWPLVIQTIQRA